MKRITWIILILIVTVSLAWADEPAAAQDAGPTMLVAVGFDGYCHSEAWCPVHITLLNESGAIEGELRVSETASTDSSVYTHRILSPAHSRKAYFLDVFLYGPAASLDVQLVADGREIVSRQIQVRFLDESGRLYGVASSDPSALNFLSDVAPAGGTARVAHLDLESLPPDPLAWEALDVLILNDVDTTALGGEQRQALETWVAHGGHLIVGGGAGAARTATGVADLLPVAVGGTRPVDDLWALGEHAGASTVTGPYAVSEATLRQGDVLVEQDGLILLARRAYGAGQVDFVAFNAGLNPFARWDDDARLWEFVVGTETVGARGLAMHNEYQAHNAINSIPGLELPSTLQILAFMLTYTLLIGPINYVVLRKLDRRELAWLTIPVLILGFTACAYATGFQIRGNEAIVHQLAAVHVPAGARVGRVSQLVGLFSPRRTNYDAWLADARVREIPGNYYGGPARQALHVVEEARGSTVTGLRVDIGGIQPFLSEGYTDAPAIESDLRLEVDEAGKLWLKGTVRNDNTPLIGSVLIVGNSEQRLGDLEPGEEAKVRLLLHSGESPIAPPTSSTYGYDIPDQILGPEDYQEDSVAYRRYQFLQAIFPYDGAGLGQGVHLVGWVEEESPLPVEVIGRPFSTIETSLYVYDLLMDGVETSATVTIPPEFIERHIEETTGYVNVWPMGFHMDPEAEAVLHFTIWPEVMVSRVDELMLNLLGSTAGVTANPPTVSLWNQENSAWEEVDVGWGQYTIPNASAYVFPPGEVLVRVEADEWAVEVQSLMITIKGQR